MKNHDDYLNAVISEYIYSKPYVLNFVPMPDRKLKAVWLPAGHAINLEDISPNAVYLPPNYLARPSTIWTTLIPAMSEKHFWCFYEFVKALGSVEISLDQTTFMRNVYVCALKELGIDWEEMYEKLGNNPPAPVGKCLRKQVQ